MRRQREPITEYCLIQQSFIGEADLYYKGLDEGLVNQRIFVQSQCINRDFRETLEPWYPESTRRGQDEGVSGVLQ